MNGEDAICPERVRWRCRRGLLELDIVLARFVEHDYPKLDAMQRKAFDEMLELPDTEFWDLIIGSRAAVQPQQRCVLEYLQRV